MAPHMYIILQFPCRFLEFRTSQEWHSPAVLTKHKTNMTDTGCNQMHWRLNECLICLFVKDQENGIRDQNDSVNPNASINGVTTACENDNIERLSVLKQQNNWITRWRQETQRKRKFIIMTKQPKHPLKQVFVIDTDTILSLKYHWKHNSWMKKMFWNIKTIQVFWTSWLKCLLSQIICSCLLMLSQFCVIDQTQSITVWNKSIMYPRIEFLSVIVTRLDMNKLHKCESSLQPIISRILHKNLIVNINGVGFLSGDTMLSRSKQSSFNSVLGCFSDELTRYNDVSDMTTFFTSFCIWLKPNWWYLSHYHQQNHISFILYINYIHYWSTASKYTNKIWLKFCIDSHKL